MYCKARCPKISMKSRFADSLRGPKRTSGESWMENFLLLNFPHVIQLV
jgi:hypothetical protein